RKREQQRPRHEREHEGISHHEGEPGQRECAWAVRPCCTSEPRHARLPHRAKRTGEGAPTVKQKQPNPPSPFPTREGGEKPARRVSNIVRGQPVTAEKLQRAKELRCEMTPEERIVWEHVRGNRLGFKFRRQQVIHGYIADFYCHEAALVV